MDIFFLSILLQRWRRLFIGKRISISHVKYLLFLEFCTKKKIDTRAFLGVGDTGDGRVGRGGGSAFFSISSQMTKIKFYQNSGKQVQYMYFFFLIFHPDHTLSDTDTPYYRKLYISIMLLKGKETRSISLNCLKSSNSKNISFCSLQNVHCSRCI